jgi:hypothetical protein
VSGTTLVAQAPADYTIVQSCRKHNTQSTHLVERRGVFYCITAALDLWHSVWRSSLTDIPQEQQCDWTTTPGRLRETHTSFVVSLHSRVYNSVIIFRLSTVQLYALWIHFFSRASFRYTRFCLTINIPDCFEHTTGSTNQNWICWADN